MWNKEKRGTRRRATGESKRTKERQDKHSGRDRFAVTCEIEHQWLKE